MDRDGLIYDWNAAGARPKPPWPIQFDDETLRDGLQSPSVTDPEVPAKLELLHLMDALGIHTADIGLPGAGPRAKAHVEALAREIVSAKLKMRANCAARTVIADIDPIADVSQRTGLGIEACLFIGSSPIRQYAEDWTVERMLEHTVNAVRHAVKLGLKVMYVTEDTTRAHPETLKRLYTAALGEGASRLCFCDTVGHATPEGVKALIGWGKSLIADLKVEAGIDWHGHRDRGLDLANTLAALSAGASRVHGAAIGMGERVGNTPMDLILVNLKLMGWIGNDLRRLPEYCRKASEACGVPIPPNYPVVGSDAFETGTGVHAAAVIKALRKQDAWLADRVYSGVPAGELGLSQRIRVGPMSGKSNVIFWLEQRGIAPTDDLVERLFKKAKASPRLLTDEELTAAAT